jgi:hypothetical protein
MYPLHVLLGLLLLASLQAPAPAAGATTNTLAAGQALAIGDKLVSSNGKFALGFFQPTAAVTSKSGNTTSSSWYLGIWFNNIPVFTTVWVANREQPITDPKLTQLKISSDGNLAIVSHASPESVVWSTHIVANRTTGAGTNTTSAVLLDTGNLALVGSPPSNVTLWQSFDYPTDVMLPGAKFGRNKLTGFSRVGVTRKSLIDPGLGSYSVEIDTSGVVLKHRNPSVVYWHWLSGGASTLKLILILKTMLQSNPRTKGLIDPTYVNDDAEEYYMYTSQDNSSLTFVSLDISGQIKMNVWSQAEQSWQAIFAQPADPCTPYATCGPFTTCDGTSPPFCDCMESFSQKSPQDWTLDDRTGGCTRNTRLHCTTSSEKNTTSSTDVFHPIAHVTLP